MAEAGEAKVSRALLQLELDVALREVFAIVAAANRYLDVTAPWNLAKTSRLSTNVFERDRALGRLRSVLFTACYSLQHVARLLAPFLPETANEVAHRLGALSVEDPPAAGRQVRGGGVLFAKVREGAKAPTRPRQPPAGVT